MQVATQGYKLNKNDVDFKMVALAFMAGVQGSKEDYEK